MITMAAVAYLVSWCVHPDFPPLNFSGADEIGVWVSSSSEEGMVKTTALSDNTVGVNMALSVVERQVRTAVNTANRIPAAFPRLRYRGVTATDPPPPAILLASPSSAAFIDACGTAASACYVNPMSPDPNELAVVYFLPRRVTQTSWVSTPAASATATDFGGAVLHEILHTLGSAHPNNPSPTNQSCLTVPGGMISDGHPRPRGIMNIIDSGSSHIGSLRVPYRDDIEGLQYVWGKRVASYVDGYSSSTGPNGPYSLTTISIGDSGYLPSLSSMDLNLSTSGRKISGVVSSPTGFVLGESSSGSSSSFSSTAFGLGVTDTSFAAVASAHGGNKVAYFWADESNKDAVVSGDWNGVPIRKAIYNGSSWLYGYVNNASGTGVLRSPTSLIRAGYDPDTGLFVLVTLGNPDHHTKKGQALVSVLSANGNAISTVGTVNNDIVDLGKPLCEIGGKCSFPIGVSVNGLAPQIYFSVGDIPLSSYVPESEVSGGWITYGGLDQSYLSAGYSVTWQSSTGSALIHSRSCATCSIDSSEFSAGGFLPVSIGTNRLAPLLGDEYNWVLRPTYWRHQ